MWNSISNLWEKPDYKYNELVSKQQSNDINVNEFLDWTIEFQEQNTINKSPITVIKKSPLQEIVSPDFILTESSPRDPTPNGCAIKLWPHQEAMLHRIRYIEKEGYLCQTQHTEASFMRYMDKSSAPKESRVCLGVMNDPPGSGKTYAILSHILSDSTPGPTIIIVPQNIYGQWRQSIELVFKNYLSKCLFSMSYADVMSIYGEPHKVNTYKVILLQDSFAEAYLKALNDKRISICRIIIDEIDIMDKFVCSSVNSRFVWLMSASYKNQTSLGPYSIGDHKKVLCKCDADFVKKSLKLPDVVTTVVKCNDKYINIFQGYFEYKQMKALHAGDLNSINRIMNISGVVTYSTIKETIKKYIDYLMKKSDNLEECEKALERYKIQSYSSEETYREISSLEEQVRILQRYREASTTIKERLERVLESVEQPSITKEKYLENDIINQIISQPTSKWLIFNDNTNVLIRYQALLQSKGINTMMLDGGNQKLIEMTLNLYKNGNVKVLLLNSMIEGAGMNLENTTHLLFMHKTEEKFIEQVVGRAQRYGRTEPLNIIMLFNESE